MKTRRRDYIMKTIDVVVISLVVSIGLTACTMSDPLVESKSQNLISISYKSYGSTPSLSPQAMNTAIEHCKSQGGLFANYRGVTIPNPLSAKEVHTFVCEKTKTDDSAVILAQNEVYAAQAQATANAISNAAIAFQPTYTTCTTYGIQTNCTSY
jgi:hypothetical protein